MSSGYYDGSPDRLEKRRYSSGERAPDDEGWVSNEIEARHRVWNAQNGERKDVSTFQEKRKIDSGIPLTAVCLRLIFKVDPNQMW